MIGGYDSKVHVYTIKRGITEVKPDQAFLFHFSLLGHMNSIKDIAISPILKQSNPDDTLAVAGTSIYISTVSQDHTIRMWKVQALENLLSAEQEENKLQEEDWSKKYQTKTSFVMTLPEEPLFNFTLESVIMHHSEAISSCQWGVDKTGKLELKDLYLLTSSFDFTVCIWRADQDTEAWSVESTLGAMVGNKHAFFGAIWLGSVRKILAYTYGGAMHQWEQDVETERWNSQLTVKGHFGAVRDLAWD
jgi:WD40 repeat protein